MTKVGQECSKKFSETKNYEELTREKCLELVTDLESKKFELNVAIFFKIRKRKLAGN